LNRRKPTWLIAGILIMTLAGAVLVWGIHSYYRHAVYIGNGYSRLRQAFAKPGEAKLGLRLWNNSFAPITLIDATAMARPLGTEQGWHRQVISMLVNPNVKDAIFVAGTPESELRGFLRDLVDGAQFKLPLTRVHILAVPF